MQTINKPWGKEEILEKNNCYVVKRISMKRGCKCSKQYHQYKTETIYVVSGILFLRMDHSLMELHPGDYYTILPTEIHRMEVDDQYGEEYTIYLECSTVELDDVVRVEDDYGRE